MNIIPALGFLTRQGTFLQERPLIPFFLCLAGGILFYNHYPVSWLIPACLFLLLVAAFSLTMWLDKKIPAQILIYGMVTLVGMLIMVPYSTPSPGDRHSSTAASRDKITYRGFVNDTPQNSRDRIEYVLSDVRPLNAAGNSIPGCVLLDTRVTERFQYGDYVQFRARLAEPRNFNNPGGFDYREYLFRKGIILRGTISDLPDLILIRRGLGNSVKIGIESYRNRLRDFIARHTETPEREILLAMILGEQRTIPDDLRERFNRTGTSHIIAISGFNVGLVAFFSVLFFMTVLKIYPRLLLAWNAPKVAYVLSLIPILLYTVIAGMGTPVMRATLMIITLMTALMLGRPKDLFNALALTAILILAGSPPALFDPSFQLSFAAVGAILTIPPKFTPFLFVSKSEIDTKSKRLFLRCIRGFLLFLLVSVSATLGTLPIIAYHFHRLSTVVIPANIVVVPFLGILTTPLSLLIIILFPLSQTVCLLLVRIADYLIQISVFFVNFFSSLPGSSFLVPPPAWYEIIGYYLILALITATASFLISKGRAEAWRIIRMPATLTSAVAIVTLIGVLFYTYLSAAPSPFLKLTAIDVGQGSSTLVQLPDGKTMLIDGGGFEGSSFDVGRYVVAPFLIRQKILKIDVVVLTHPHPDHLNGLLYILENFPVGEIWTNGDIGLCESYAVFQDIVHRKNLSYRILAQGQPDRKLGALQIHILNPEPASPVKSPEMEDYQLENDRSLVLHLQFGQVRILLPGDIAEPTEERLVTSSEDLQSDVILVPHHGGRMSSSPDFLARVRPVVALIGCGQNNRYRVPHADVLQRYERIGAKVLRTDQDGAITLMTDGIDLFHRGDKINITDCRTPH